MRIKCWEFQSFFYASRRRHHCNGVAWRNPFSPVLWYPIVQGLIQSQYNNRPDKFMNKVREPIKAQDQPSLGRRCRINIINDGFVI